MQNNIAIKVDQLSKQFILPHEKTDTVKSIFTSFYKKRNISKSRQKALINISFDVKKGEFFGIVGRNGSGKSTLLKTLASIYQPTSGNVSIDGRLVPFIELGVGFNPELTGRDNVYLNGAMMGFSKMQIDEIYEDIVQFAELEEFMDQKLKNYSSGMQVRLAFSLATRSNADILLVDEVLAVGDASFQRKCFSYFKELKEKKKTVVFVTHSMDAVREYCDRAMLIEKSKIQIIGDPEDVARKYSMLFIDDGVQNRNTKNEEDHWGTGGVEIKTVTAKVHVENIQIKSSIKVKEDIGRILFGLHISSADGKEITAMNNRMLNIKDVVNPRQGDNIDFTWDVMNIFNDGDYSITLTFNDDLGNVLEWFAKAQTFSVRRTERSTTSVLPPVNVDFEIK